MIKYDKGNMLTRMCCTAYNAPAYIVGYMSVYLQYIQYTICEDALGANTENLLLVLKWLNDNHVIMYFYDKEFRKAYQRLERLCLAGYTNLNSCIRKLSSAESD